MSKNELLELAGELECLQSSELLKYNSVEDKDISSVIGIIYELVDST